MKTFVLAKNIKYQKADVKNDTCKKCFWLTSNNNTYFRNFQTQSKHQQGLHS